MKLHESVDEFRSFSALTAQYKHIPESAVLRDYYIVMLLDNLANSDYADSCVFKGGTSLSKCYPGSIERFSEDIDLTFLGMDLSDKECDRTIKKIEKAITEGAETEKIAAERSDRSKSMWCWFGDKASKIKLEIGSSVRPDPFSKRKVKTYIQEFLECHNGDDDIEKYELREVELNVLSIERTFVDKLMSVKRHALCGTLGTKVRHIYDVTRLFAMPEIKTFLEDRDNLKKLMTLTKKTDDFYLAKRNLGVEYEPKGAYDFESWEDKFSPEIRTVYENLHKDLLYTDEKQNFDDAIRTFTEINNILKSISE